MGGFAGPQTLQDSSTGVKTSPINVHIPQEKGTSAHHANVRIPFAHDGGMSSTVRPHSTIEGSVQDATTSASSSENCNFSDAVSVTLKDLGGNETITAMWQLLHRFQLADGETRAKIQNFTSKPPIGPRWGGYVDQIVDSGIAKGNEIFNQMRIISEHLYPRYARRRVEKFPLIKLKEFIILEQINTGAVGQIHFGFDKSGHYIAAKIMDKSQVSSNPALLQRLKEEIRIVSRVRHENIVETRSILECPDKIVHIMEYCDGGDIISFLRQHSYLDEANAQCFFKKIIDGVYYLHSSGIVHRDLKPENLLLSYKGLSHEERKLKRVSKAPIASEYEVKVADFGAATFFRRGRLLHDTVGTLSYAAPEVLKASKSEGYEAEPVDVWSLGVVLYAMLFGCLPWNNESKGTMDAYNQIINMPLVFPPGRLKHISSDVYTLLKSMLIIDPKSRVTLKQVRNNEWVSQATKKAPVPSSVKTGRLSVSSTCYPVYFNAPYPFQIADAVPFPWKGQLQLKKAPVGTTASPALSEYGPIERRRPVKKVDAESVRALVFQGSSQRLIEPVSRIPDPVSKVGWDDYYNDSAKLGLSQNSPV